MQVRVPSLLFLLPSRIQPYVVLLAVCMIHLTLGTLYCIGNLVPYVSSYLRFDKHTDINIGAMAWYGALTSAAQGAFMFVGGLIEHRFGTRAAIATGCGLVVTGVATTYFAIQRSYIAPYFTYGIVFGSGVGIAYAPCIACGIRWLPKRKGLVTGCVVAGFGLGAFVFNFVITYFVNPENKKADFTDTDGTKYFKDDPEILRRTPFVFLVLAACYAGIQVLAMLFVANPPGTERVELKDNYSMTPKQLVSTTTFYFIWVIFFINSAAIAFFSSYYKEFGGNFISDDHFLSLSGSIGSIANSLGRIFWGYIGDHYSYQVGISCSSAILAFLVFTFPATIYGHKAMFFIWVVSTFFTLSGNFALHPMATAKIYGRGYFSTNYGIVFTSSMVSSLVFAVVVTLALNGNNYYVFFLLLGCLGMISTLLGMTINFTKYGKPRPITDGLPKI